MKSVAVTIKGMENIAVEEVKDFGLNAKVIDDGRVIIEYNKIQEIYSLAYMARSLSMIYILLDDFKFKNLQEIIKKIKLLNIQIKGKFRVDCHRNGEHDFTSVDVEKGIGEVIYNNGFKVDLNEPNTIVIVDINDDKCYVGIDAIGFDASKRDYRVKSAPGAINACLAFCLVKENWKIGESLLDPFCKDGTVVIEAASYALNVPNGYFKKRKYIFSDEFDFGKLDKKIKNGKLEIYGSDPLLHAVRDCEIHAKLANVNKSIDLSRADIDWLDTKFDDDSLDKVITVPPFQINRFGDKKLIDLFDQLFDQLKFIVKASGLVVILIPKKEQVIEAALKHKFKFKSEEIVSVGKSDYFILKFKK